MSRQFSSYSINDVDGFGQPQLQSNYRVSFIDTPDGVSIPSNFPVYVETTELTPFSFDTEPFRTGANEFDYPTNATFPDFNITFLENEELDTLKFLLRDWKNQVLSQEVDGAFNPPASFVGEIRFDPIAEATGTGNDPEQNTEVRVKNVWPKEIDPINWDSTSQDSIVQIDTTWNVHFLAERFFS